jgi:molybdopterin/thiamine biosynthesis adenylyltransferase
MMATPYPELAEAPPQTAPPQPAPPDRPIARSPRLRMRRPVVKEAHRPVLLPDGRIQIGSNLFGVAAEITGPRTHTDCTWRVLELLDGSRSPDDVCRLAGSAFPEIGPDGVRAIIDQLTEAGFVQDAAAPIPSELTEADLERYSRTERFYTWVDTTPRATRFDAQRRLKASRVAILGLGGTGSAIAQSLVACGVGQLSCYDFDTVEVSNLTRQLLYSHDDLGRPKAERAVARLRRLNSAVEVAAVDLRVRSTDDLVPIMAGCDLFILAADTPRNQIDRWANQAALRTRTPWITSSYEGPRVSTQLHIPFQTPCRECVRQQLATDERTLRWQGEPLPMPWAQAGPRPQAAIAPTAVLAGQLAALEAIYFLADLRPQTRGRMCQHNLLVYDQISFVDAPMRPDCPECGR